MVALADLPAELPPPRWAVAAERFYRTATIITASDEDVRAAWGGRVSIAEAAHHWLDCGARLVG